MYIERGESMTSEISHNDAMDFTAEFVGYLQVILPHPCGQ